MEDNILSKDDLKIVVTKFCEDKNISKVANEFESLLTRNSYEVSTLYDLEDNNSVELFLKSILEEEVEIKLGLPLEVIDSKFRDILNLALVRLDIVKYIYRGTELNCLDRILKDGYSDLFHGVLDVDFKSNDLTYYGYTYDKAFGRVIRYIYELDRFLHSRCKVNSDILDTLVDRVRDYMITEINVVYNHKSVINIKSIIEIKKELMSPFPNSITVHNDKDSYLIDLKKNYFKYYIESNPLINYKVNEFITDTFGGVILDKLYSEYEYNTDYSMELGNSLMGNSRDEFNVPREWTYIINRLLRKLEFDGYNFESNELDKKGYFENGTFIIRPYYWGDDEEKEELPNFEYKPLGFKLEWYKYPLRDSYMNTDINLYEFSEIITACIKSLKA